jgi:hypothetical protein
MIRLLAYRRLQHVASRYYSRKVSLGETAFLGSLGQNVFSTICEMMRSQVTSYEDNSFAKTTKTSNHHVQYDNRRQLQDLSILKSSSSQHKTLNPL